MNKAHIELLKESYKKACNDYLKAFCANYDFQYDNDAWVAGDVGTIALVADFFFDFNDVIKYSVDNELTDWKELVEWYDYTLFAHEYGLDMPNFSSWHKGCPRLSKEEQQRLINLKKELKNAIDDYKNRY